MANKKITNQEDSNQQIEASKKSPASTKKSAATTLEKTAIKSTKKASPSTSIAEETPAPAKTTKSKSTKSAAESTVEAPVTKATKSTTKTSSTNDAESPVAPAKKSTSRASAARSLQLEDLVQVETTKPVQLESFVTSSEGTITHEAPSSRTPINGISIYRQARDSRTPIKRNVPKEVYFLDSDSVLPEYYGITKVQVFVKDSEWIFVYWDFSQQDLQKFPFADPTYRFVLRLLEVAPNGVTQEVDEIAISQVTTSWYVHIPKAGKKYKIQIGLRSGTGDFLVIAASNTVLTPTLELITDPNINYGDQDLESYRQLLKMSGAGELADHLSSGSFSGDLVSRLSLAPSSFSGSVFSGSFHSSTFASETLSARTNAVLDGKNRKFWLVIDAEVIVYGATEPDAKVSFMGKNIRLNPDGTFGVRMALPDGKIEFPVIATSADGEETKTVRPVVSRKTEPK